MIYKVNVLLHCSNWVSYLENIWKGSFPLAHKLRTDVEEKGHTWRTTSRTRSRNQVLRRLRFGCPVSLEPRTCPCTLRPLFSLRRTTPRFWYYRQHQPPLGLHPRTSPALWLEWVIISVLCEGQLWYRTFNICTAVSVFPVPGGPTTIVNPGWIPDIIAPICK